MFYLNYLRRFVAINDLSIFNFSGLTISRILKHFVCICSCSCLPKNRVSNFPQVFKLEKKKRKKLFNYIHITFCTNWNSTIPITDLNKYKPEGKNYFRKSILKHDLFIFYQSKMCGWFTATRAPFKSAIKTKQVPRRIPTESIFPLHVRNQISMCFEFLC